MHESDHPNGTSRGPSVCAAVGAVVPALFAIILLRLFVVGLYRVPTKSMAPTILPGSCVVGERVSYHLRSPSVGDVCGHEVARMVEEE